jgi:uncharacterized protein (DUF488 family)
LALVHALGGFSKNLDFQKLLFLHCQELSDPPYHFVPYRFGAFSFECYADRRRLIERRLLEDNDSSWQLSPQGVEQAEASMDEAEALGKFVGRFRKLRGDALVAETYRSHPYYATRSEIAERVLRGDKVALRRIAAARAAVRSTPLATIGYEGRSLDQYLNILLMAGVTLLCDVRRNPLSRKYGFSKRTLANACAGVGIRYEHLPQLGIASAQRQGLDDEAAYHRLFEDYRRNALPKEGPALNQIRAWVAAGERVALTCFEHEPEKCHRHCVADALVEHFGASYTPHHL